MLTHSPLPSSSACSPGPGDQVLARAGSTFNGDHLLSYCVKDVLGGELVPLNHAVHYDLVQDFEMGLVSTHHVRKKSTLQRLHRMYTGEHVQCDS